LLCSSALLVLLFRLRTRQPLCFTFPLPFSLLAATLSSVGAMAESYTQTSFLRMEKTQPHKKKPKKILKKGALVEGSPEGSLSSAYQCEGDDVRQIVGEEVECGKVKVFFLSSAVCTEFYLFISALFLLFQIKRLESA